MQYPKCQFENRVGMAYLDLGMLYKARKRSGQARQYTAEAIQIFKQCKAEVYLNQANGAFDSLV